MPSTTVWITPENKSRLAALKRHPKESYNDVIARLIDMAVDDEPLSEEAIRGIEEALEDIRAGRLYSEDEIEREFGVEE
jgi:predicted transcriptional regulator